MIRYLILAMVGLSSVTSKSCSSGEIFAWDPGLHCIIVVNILKIDTWKISLKINHPPWACTKLKSTSIQPREFFHPLGSITCQHPVSPNTAMEVVWFHGGRYLLLNQNPVWRWTRDVWGSLVYGCIAEDFFMHCFIIMITDYMMSRCPRHDDHDVW